MRRNLSQHQKEIYQKQQDLQLTFKANELLSKNLRNPLKLPKYDIKNERPQTQKMLPGKVYVEKARLDKLKGMTFQNEINLPSRPNANRVQSTREMIDKQIKSRRERHIQNLAQYEKKCEDFQQQEYKIFTDIQSQLWKYFGQNQQETDDYFLKFDKKLMLKKENEIIIELNQYVKNINQERLGCTDGIDKKLEKSLKLFQKQSEKELQLLDKYLFETSYVLKDQINEIIQNLKEQQEQKIKETKSRNSELFIQIHMKQELFLESIKEQKNQIIIDWRIVKHEQSIETFLTQISDEKVTNPKERQQIFQDLKQLHLNLFKNKRNLQQQLQNVNLNLLTQEVMDKFQNQFQSLNEIGSKQLDQIVSRLIKNHDQNSNNLKNILQELKQKIKDYDSEIEYDEKYDEMVEQIEKEQKDLLTQILSYVDESDYVSTEILTNLSDFYLQLAKKLDQFRKNQQDFQHKQLMKIAKMEDQNDEDLELANEDLNVEKKKLSESIYHQMLDQYLQSCFIKLDQVEQKIRNIHQVNLQIVQGNPELVDKFITEFELEICPFFNLSTYDKKQELLNKYQLELENQIKQQIEKEREEKEKEEALNLSQTAKPKVSKKDPKAQQKEFEAKYKEYLSQQKPQQIIEFKTNNQILIQYESLDQKIQQILQVQDQKNLQNPLFNGDPLFDQASQFQQDFIELCLIDFRNKLFEQIKKYQIKMHQELKLNDENFIQKSLSKLDQRIKEHYPKKGQVEVEIYQSRSKQITDHKDRYERQQRNILQKNQLQNQQFNYYSELCLKTAKQYLEDQEKMEQILPKLPQLSKLQGQLNTSKEKQIIFQEKYQEYLDLIKSLSSDPSLINSNNQFLAQIKKDPEYSEQEIEWYEKMLQEIQQEIQEQQDKKIHRFQLLQDFLNEKNIEAYQKVEQQYKLSQNELAQKDGTGKLYGKPRRMAQEKFRLEMTKCEQSQTCLEKLIDDISQCKESQKLRKLMICFRNCLNRYGHHVDAFKKECEPMVRFSIKEDQYDVFVQDQEEDLNLQESELEKLGLLYYQKDKKQFTQLMIDIEQQVKDECQKIYQQNAQQWLNGPDKLPDWIRVYFENQKKNIHQYRLNCCRNLRDICFKFQELSPKINEYIFDDIYNRFNQKIENQLQIINNNFNQETKQNLNLQNNHIFQLRPNLGNPSCVEELKQLQIKENQRKNNFQTFIEQYKKDYQENEFKISNQFFVTILNYFEFLAAYYDNFLLFEDFNKLPGDEQIIKKHQNLSNLLKFQQDGTKINHNSERSVQKIWQNYPLNTFQVEHLIFKFEEPKPQEPVQQQPQKATKQKPNHSKNQSHQSQISVIDDINSKTIKSYKNKSQKTAFQNQNKYLRLFKQRFDQSIENLNQNYQQETTQEQKHNYKWLKSLKELHN